MLAAFSFFTICYVAGEVISIVLCLQGSVRMQATILSLVFKLTELMFETLSCVSLSRGP